MPLMRFVLDDGTEVELEADTGSPVSGYRHEGTYRSAPEDAVTRVERSFVAALDTVKKTVAAAVEELRDGLPDRPDELEIEFGIKASLEANGLIFAKAGGEALFNFKAVWKKPVPPADPS